jgi:hypothetical protein
MKIRFCVALIQFALLHSACAAGSFDTNRSVIPKDKAEDARKCFASGLPYFIWSTNKEPLIGKNVGRGFVNLEPAMALCDFDYETCITSNPPPIKTLFTLLASTNGEDFTTVFTVVDTKARTVTNRAGKLLHPTVLTDNYFLNDGRKRTFQLAYQLVTADSTGKTNTSLSNVLKWHVRFPDD